MQHQFRSLLSLIFFLLLNLGNGVKAEEAVDLDTVGTNPATGGIRSQAGTGDGLKMHLYADFTVEVMSRPVYYGLDSSGNEVTTNSPTFTFGQNHFGVIGMFSYRDMLSLNLDLAQDFFEIEWNITPTMNLRVGKIFVPFGEFEYHHIYGGMVDENSIFLPKFWCDYGAGFHFKLFPGGLADIFVGNGFAVNNGSPVFNLSGVRDSNKMKSAAGRLKWSPLPDLFASFSGYYDVNSLVDDFRDFTLMYGLDAGFDPGPLHFQAGGVVAEIFNHDATPVHGLLLGSKWYRWSWYAEGRWNFTRLMAVRMRGGALDPSSLVDDMNDQSDINLSLIAHPGPFELSLTWFHNMQIFENFPTSQVNVVGTLKNDYDWFLVKVLVRI